MTDSFEQISFGTDSFADNPEPRCPCLLLLDTSYSMQGNPIEELNKGLIAYKTELSEDSLAMKRVETAIVTFGGSVQVDTAFCTTQDFQPPSLEPQGNTPMGAAISEGLEMIRQRKEKYRQNGISFYRPWVFLITDGTPTDEWEHTASLIKVGEDSKAFAFFAVGVEGANMAILKKISVREPLKLNGLKFQELFVWLSNSMKAVSQSVPGDIVKIESPEGWAEI
jgi:uncharacterized protein YegL